MPESPPNGPDPIETAWARVLTMATKLNEALAILEQAEGSQPAAPPWKAAALGRACGTLGQARGGLEQRLRQLRDCQRLARQEPSGKEARDRASRPRD